MKKLTALVLAVLLLLPALVSCGGTDANTIKVAATSTPHAEILEICKDAMAAKGYTLQIEVVSDYITPNDFTESGDVLANYFQHKPYLDDYNASNKAHLIPVAAVHYEPYCIYKGTVDSLAELEDGAAIAVPNDPSNEARALQLLAAQGLFTLREGAGLTATKNDIIDNPHNYDIREMEAALLPTVLDEVAVAVINGNYALGANLSSEDAIASEDAASEAAQTFANVLVVKEGNENDPRVLALIEALLSDAVRDYITNTYNGAVVPIF